MSCIIEKQDSEINEFFYISLISRKIMALSVNFNKTDVRKFTDFFLRWICWTLYTFTLNTAFIKKSVEAK